MTSVLFTNHTAQLGGAELCLVDLARTHPSCRVALLADGPLVNRLQMRGIDVRLLAGSSGLNHVRKQAKLQAILSSLPAVWHDVQTVATEAADFDLIWANTHKAFVVSAFAGLLARKPVVYHLHDMLHPGHFSFWNRRAVVTLANACAAAVVANSEATAASFVQSGGRQTLLRILHNGFEFDPAETTSELPPTEDRFLVGLFSRLSPWKGQHVLLEALSFLDRRFEAILVGDALFKEQDYVQSLHRQVERLGLSGRVRFLGFRDDATQLMAECNAVVHCSVLPEAFGRVVVEGMASGRPVVAVGDGGVLEIIDDGRTGLLVPPGDALALAQALRRLETNPEFAASLGLQGQQSVINRFSLERISGHLSTVLREVCP